MKMMTSIHRIGDTIGADTIPEPLQKTRIGDVFYLAGDVHAITSRDYPNSDEIQDKTLAGLFTEQDPFYPFNPKMFH